MISSWACCAGHVSKESMKSQTSTSHIRASACTNITLPPSPRPDGGLHPAWGKAQKSPNSVYRYSFEAFEIHIYGSSLRPARDISPSLNEICLEKWQLGRAGEHTEHLVCGSAGPEPSQQATRAVSRNNLYGFMLKSVGRRFDGSVRPLPDTDGVEVA